MAKDQAPPVKPNDRLVDDGPAAGNEDPRIFVVADGRRFPRPGLETFFARAADEAPGAPLAGSPAAGGGTSPQPGVAAAEGVVLAGSYCSCNKVCTCVPVCGCVGFTSCGCVGYSCGCVGHSSCYGGGGGGYGCSCAPVH